MPRPPRLVMPGVPLHVVQRGNNRMATFHHAADRECYREALDRASRRFGCAIHAYVLMTNHVHLLITPDDDSGPSHMMQSIGRKYVRYVNGRYERTGTLWEGRFKSSLVYSERYFLTCSRYIELNPVRAQIVAEPDQYPWSSHRHNALGEADALVTPHGTYVALGSSLAERRAAYRALFEAPLALQTLNIIRQATNDGGVLGDDDSIERIESTVRRRVTRLAHGGDRRSGVFHASTESARRVCSFNNSDPLNRARSTTLTP